MRHGLNASVVVGRWLLWLAMGWGGAGLLSSRAAQSISPAASVGYDYAKPKLVTGTLYALGSDRKKVLYTFRRTATQTGAVVHVERQFLCTNGTLAAVEKVLYESNQLVSYQMQDFQAHVSGAISIQPDPQHPGRGKIFIGYAHSLHPPKGRARRLRPDTVIDDTLYPFMLVHWDDLMRGKTVKCRLVSLNWERTFKFGLVKTGESVRNGKPVVRLRMRPTNPFVALFVKPILVTVQARAPHHILSYIGPTTPRVKKGRSWKYLDAETVFH